MEKLTLDEVLNLYVPSLKTLNDEINEEEEKTLMKELVGVDGLLEWIDQIIARDVKEYFTARTDEQRNILRGMSQRLLDFKKRLMASREPEIKKKNIPLSGY